MSVKFVFVARPSDSPLVEAIWRTESAEDPGSFTSTAESHWGIVVPRQKGRTWLTVRRPETLATPSPIPEEAEFFGIVFKHGTFMPQLPTAPVVLGKGKRLFEDGTDAKLKLVETQSYSSGVVGLIYEPETAEVPSMDSPPMYEKK